MTSFVDRREAGRLLAARLSEYAHRPDVIVLGVPRGGIPVAYEVARALGVPLDVFIVQKVYQPGRDDVHVGTLASGGYETFDTDAVTASGVDRRIAEREMARARTDLAYKERLYRGTTAFPDIRGKTVVVISDGIVTGGVMVAAVATLHERGAVRVVVAAPVATPNAQHFLEKIADDCVCLVTPDPFYRIGVWYEDSVPVSDASVLVLIDGAARQPGAAA
jgi:predicted phosphoribosyltransferase